MVSGLAATVNERVAPISADVLSEVLDWSPGDLNQLQASAVALANQAQPDQAALAAAGVSLSKADAAVAQESARTGFGAMFGRRKRLAAVSEAREAAWQGWSTTVAIQGDLMAQRHFAEQLADALPRAINSSEERWRTSMTVRGTEALTRWLATTATAAARLQPPPPVSEQLASRTWGDARPEVRRHLLVPSASAADLNSAAEDLTGAVSVHSAVGLQRPLAVAWLLGLSASSFEPTS